MRAQDRNQNLITLQYTETLPGSNGGGRKGKCEKQPCEPRGDIRREEQKLWVSELRFPVRETRLEQGNSTEEGVERSCHGLTP